MSRFLFVLGLLISNSLLSQEDTCPTPNIPMALVEKAPIYPGCDSDNNEALIKCLSQSISDFIVQEFNLPKKSKSEGNRVYVHFTIDTNGRINNVRTRGSSVAIEKEAARVIQKLPQMHPGQQKGKDVRVLYTLPIIFD